MFEIGRADQNRPSTTLSLLSFSLCNNTPSPTNRAISLSIIIVTCLMSFFSIFETRTSNRYGNIYNGQRSMFAVAKKNSSSNVCSPLIRFNLNRIPVENTSVRCTNSSTTRRLKAYVFVSKPFRYMALDTSQTLSFHNQYLNTKNVFFLKSYLSAS